MPILGVVTGAAVLSALVASSALADPAADAMAKLNDLSRQAEQATEAMHSAQLDLNKKLDVQAAADKQLTQAQADVSVAQTQLSSFQTSVDKVAAATYMGGRTDGMAAILTAESPQGLIDKLAMQRVMATQMSAQMTNYRRLAAAANTAQATAAKSAADAKTAAEQAAAVRTDLQAKQNKLQVQIAVVKSQYNMLSPNQRVALAAPVPVAAVLPPAAAPGPDVVAAAPDALAPPANIAPPEAAVPSVGGGTGEGAIAVQAALTRVGSPYSWGAAGPGAFDCSGLVMWAFQQAGISLPHSSYALAAGGTPVSRDQLQPGDVVNFYSDASHTGIYVGDGMVVHASTYGVPVKVVPLDGAGPFYNARRY
ncbi:MAG: peptidoglycan hydrolase RipC [Mycobacterium sp.]